MAFDSLAPFARWLAATPVSKEIGKAAWVTPAVQSVHILAIAIVMSGMLMLDLRLLRVVGRQQSVQTFTDRYLPWVWWALLVLLTSGVVLIVGEPARELQSTVFALKMGLILGAAGLALLVRRPLPADHAYWDAPHRRPVGQAIAVASMTIWACVVFAGRWIAYAQG